MAGAGGAGVNPSGAGKAGLDDGGLSGCLDAAQRNPGDRAKFILYSAMLPMGYFQGMD